MAITLPWIKTVNYANPNDPDDVISKDIRFENAYAVISDYNGTRDRAFISVTIYEDNSKTSPIVTYGYEMPHDVDTNAENIIKQAYHFVKTKQEFSSANDA